MKPAERPDASRRSASVQRLHEEVEDNGGAYSERKIEIDRRQVPHATDGGKTADVRVESVKPGVTDIRTWARMRAW